MSSYGVTRPQWVKIYADYISAILETMLWVVFYDLNLFYILVELKYKYGYGSVTDNMLSLAYIKI